MVHVSLLNHKDMVGDLVQLFNLVFSAKTSESMWMWKHIDNPLNPSGSQVVVALDGKKVVGARPLMLAKLRFRGEAFVCGQPCDTMVHPDYQRQGIFTRMNRMMIQHAADLGLTLFYNFPNERSKPGYLKQGWKEVSQVERLVRIENPVKVAAEKMGKGLSSEALGRSYNLFFGPGAKRGGAPGDCPSQPWHITTGGSANKKLEGLNLLCDDESMELDRSLSYLRWRIDDRPERESRYVMCLDGSDSGQLLGYAVVSVSKDKDGLRAGEIVDYLISARARRDAGIAHSLLSKAVGEMIHLGCDVMHAWAGAGNTVDEVLKDSLGFKSLFQFPLNLILRNQPLWFVAREMEGSSLRPEFVHDPAFWRLTPVFYDTV